MTKKYILTADNIIDNLTSADPSKSLSAKQGKTLDEKKVDVYQGTEKSGQYLCVNAQGNVDTQAISTYIITSSAGSNGTIRPLGDSLAVSGSNKSYTFVPNTDYIVNTVTVDGVVVQNPSNPYIFSNITSDHTIAVTFKHAPCTITTTAGANGTISPASPTVEYNATQSFTITPNNGYEVNTATYNGSDIKSSIVNNVYTTPAVTSNGTLNVTFKLKTYTISTTVGSNGSMTPTNPAVNHGSSQVFTISPSTGYEVNDLLLDGNSVKSSIVNNTYTISNVTSTHTLNVSFKIKTYTVTASVAQGSGSCSAIPPTVNHGGSCSIDYSANKGYVFDKLLINGSVVTEDSPYTITNITQNTTVLAYFAEKTTSIYTIIINNSSVPNDITFGGDWASWTQAQRRALLQEHRRPGVVYYDGSKPKVRYFLNPSNLNQKADGTASNLTGSDGDVMMIDDRAWYLFTNDGEKRTISISWDEKFDVNAVCTTTFNNTEDQYRATGIFEGTMSNSQLRSVNVSSNPTVSKTNEAFYDACVYNRGGDGSRYNQMLVVDFMWFYIVMLADGGNRDSQTQYGKGYTDSGNSAACAVNKDWSATSAWNSPVYTDGKHGVTCCGIQNPWGNVYKFVGEFLWNGSKAPCFSIKGGSDHYDITTSSGTPASTWHVGPANTSTGSYLKQIAGALDMYIPFVATDRGGSDSTYYCDYYSLSSSGCAYVGGRWGNASDAGAFFWSDNSLDYSSSYVGSRLSCSIPFDTQ